MKNQPEFVKITKKEYDSFNDSDKKKCIQTKQKGKHWQYFKPNNYMKKTKLQKLTAIKKNLENRLNTNKFNSTTAKRLFNLNEKLLELEFEKYINNQQKKHV
jgi:hypothetical protein